MEVHAPVPAAFPAAVPAPVRPCGGCKTPTAVEDLVESHYGYAHRNWQHADAVVWLCVACREPNMALAAAPTPASARTAARRPSGGRPSRRRARADSKVSGGRR